MIYVKRFLYLIWMLINFLLALTLFTVLLVSSPVINIIVYLVRGRALGVDYIIDILDWFESLNNKFDPDN